MRTNIFYDVYEKANSDDNLPPRFPYFIDVELTNKCNLSCNFCSRQFMKRKQGFMKDSTFNQILEEIKRIKTPVRFIRWGEPFLHPKIFNYIKTLKQYNIPVHITTNGLLFNNKIINGIVKTGVDSIIFSMQGTIKTEYESSRIGGNYDELTKNIKKLVTIRGNKEKPFIAITSTVTQNQGIDKEEFIKHWKLHVDDVVNVGHTNLSRIDNSIGKHIVCKRPWQQLNIDWDGNVSACCDDFDRLMSLGNINNDSLIKLWNSKTMIAYRTLIKNEKHDSLSLCSKCYPAHGDIWKS